ncbi:hypothetical protein KY343_03530 [Candidatus Woesearchaeota archaeon]|nr:hypothetical protein [Candidatus Woesearchaeota archaeon]
MSNQETILNTIKIKGPVIPNDIAKVIETNILFASAHLSELASSNKLKISHTKVGGTPVYYLPGQESRLQEFYKYLNDKEKKAFDLLKEKKTLKDDKLEPVIRVALRSIKDFAVPLHITINNEKILFWKWYLLSNDEAGTLIKLQLQPPKEIEKPKEPIQQKQETKEIEKQPEKKIEPKQEIKPKPQQKPIEQQKKLNEEIKEKKIIVKKQDSFLNKLQNYFNQKKIQIVEYDIIRKNSEIDAVIKFYSVVGDLEYYCKAKNKKTITNTDLSNAFVQGQFKKLPVLFLMTGNLTKKAEELLNTEFKKGLVVKKI